VGTAHGGRAQVCTGGMEGPGKQYPCEKTGGLEPGRFKPKSVNSSVSDTLPFEAISIMGRDCFWDGSVPNPLVSVGSPTMSVSSIIPELSGAGARVS
jgi:hypothetical protein